MTTVVTAPGQDLSLCIPDLRSKRRDAALAEMAMAARAGGVVTEPDLLTDLLKVRERLGSTAIGKGVALPQARSITVTSPRLVMARTRGIDWGAEDGNPVTLVLLSLAPAQWSDEAYHGLIARAASAARLQRTRHKLLAADSPELLAAAWREALS